MAIAQKTTTGLLATLCVVLCAVAAADFPPPPAVAWEDVDLAASGVFLTDAADPAFVPRQSPVEPMALRSALGMDSQGWKGGWAGYNPYAPEQGPHPKRPVVCYRLALRRPLALGACGFQAPADLPGGGPTTFFILRQEAPFPGDPDDPNHWQPVPPAPGQDAGFVILPPETITRAVLLRHEPWGLSALERWWLFHERLFDLRHAALGQAESGPGAADSMNLTRGRRWVNTWPADDFSPPARHPVSEVAPSWAILVWEEPVSLHGLHLQSNIADLQVLALRPEAKGNPANLPRAAWRRLSVVGKDGWHGFPAVETRAIKLQIDKVATANRWPYQKGQVARIDSLRVFTRLGAGDPPEAFHPRQPDTEPPFSIVCPLEQEGEVCLVIEDAAGRRVRNLVAQEERQPGLHRFAWDLKDFDGRTVPPGTYRWRGLVGPRPEVTHEMSVYPNVAMQAPHNSAWLNGASGSGGWLADHTGNSCVTTFGESVFIGAYCAESGVALIETDLDGGKRWGRHNLMAWTGPRLLANDGDNVYAAVAVDRLDRLWRIDGARQTHDYLKLPATRERQAGLRGLAVDAQASRLYLAISSNRSSWLANALLPEDVDLDRLRPAPPRPPQVGNPEDLPDPRQDILRLLRLTGDPPGHPHASEAGVYLVGESGPGRRQHLLLPFTEPVPIGTLIFSPAPDMEADLRFSLAAPDAPYPPNPNDEAHWQSFARLPNTPWIVLPAPAETVTRALRITFVKGGEDDLLEMLEAENGAPVAGRLEFGTPAATTELLPGASQAWTGRLEGLRILRRRYASLGDTARVRVNSGQVGPDHLWDAQRREPLSADHPAIYVMEWDTPQSVRALAIKEIDGDDTRIDVYTGPPTGDIDIEGQQHWSEVAAYRQRRRDYYEPSTTRNPRARYLDGCVDLGDLPPTRAVRLRIVSQWMRADRPLGVRADHGGTRLDAARCRVWGVAPLSYLGGEPPVPATAAARLESRDLASGQLLHEAAVALDGPLRLGRQGQLLALQARQLVVVDPDSGATTPLVADLVEPTAFTTDEEGRLWIFDAAPERQNVRVYDQRGEFLRQVGTPGGWVPGPWDPSRMHRVVDLAIDGRAQLWAVETASDPKRVTVWDSQGRLVRELLGNTRYGGGGILDRYDKRRLRYHRMRFELDWETGHSRLANLNFQELPVTGGFGIPDLFPVRRDGQLYLATGVSHPEREGLAGFVFIEEADKARLVAAVGCGSAFAPLAEPSFQPLLQGRVPGDVEFIYADHNGDGLVQPEEVQIVAIPPGAGGPPLRVYGFNHDLSLCTNRMTHFVPRETLVNGTPIFEEQPLAGLRRLRESIAAVGYSYVRALRGGDYFVKLETEPGRLFNAVLSPAGELRWKYPIQHEGVQSLRIYPWRPGWVVHQFVMIGNEIVEAGDLGEIFATNSNSGQWNLWTVDGLLFGQIFLHQQHPQARRLNFPEHARGTSFANLTMGQEHFSGSLIRSEEDGQTYVVCGHNHITVAKISGWERYRRLAGQTTVTPDDLAAVRQWELAQAARQVFVRAPAIAVGRGRLDSVLDGSVAALETGSADRPVTLNLAYDQQHLFLCCRVSGHGPLANAGGDWRQLFASGAAVDLRFGLDPEADPQRQAPVRGDLRLLLTIVDGKPIAVLYDAVCPDAPGGQAWEVHTPAGGRTAFDRVVQLPQARLHTAVERDREQRPTGYQITAAIPLADLGLTPTAGRRILFDWGILVTDTGRDVRTRQYWADPASTGIADLAVEARLHPNLWGSLEFTDAGADGLPRLVIPRLTDQPAKGDIDDIIDEIQDL